MPILEGQRALVTGAGRGIGRAIALALGAEGAELALAARTTEQLEATADEARRAGASAVSVHSIDLADAEAVDHLCSDLVARGGVDIVVNNAGIGTHGEALAGDPDEWERLMQVNVLAPMRLTRRLAPAMAQRERGTIVNIGSIAAIEGMTRSGAYAASKHALRGWSLSCYQQLRTYGIKVTLINPAFVDTPLTAGVQGAKRERMLQPEDIAEAAMLAIRTSPSCCPEEITLRLTKRPVE